MSIPDFEDIRRRLIAKNAEISWEEIGRAAGIVPNTLRIFVNTPGRELHHRTLARLERYLSGPTSQDPLASLSLREVQAALGSARQTVALLEALEGSLTGQQDTNHDDDSDAAPIKRTAEVRSRPLASPAAPSRPSTSSEGPRKASPQGGALRG